MRDEVHPEFRHKHFHNDSEKSNDSSIQSKFQKIHTEWSKVYIGALLLFFINLEKNVLALSDWLYMKQLDPTVSPDFFGAVLGVARIGHAVATIAFSYWRSKTKTTKKALLIGRLCDAIAFILYCGVEFFGSSEKRYVLMVVYFLVYTLGLGSSVTLRTYMVDCSLPEDRSSVFALRTLATVSGMLLPPILQLLFTSFEYPGISIGHEAIRLHLFSGPVLITLITNILATLTIVFLFSEPASLEQMKIQETLNKGKQSEKFESCSFGVKTMNFLKNPSFSWHLISMICLAKVAIYASNATVTVVHSAWSQIAFGWSSSETVIKLTNAKIYLGIVSITITLVLFKLGKKIGDHVVLLICSLFILSHFIITYPMPELATLTTPLYNETTHGGCNEIEYSWCGARVGNSDVWVYSSVALMVIAVQIALVSSDAIFSNLLEKIDQSMMQGLLIVLSDAVQMIASMYSADLFTRWGLEPLWILNIFISIFVVFISIFYFKRFKL